MPTRHDPPRPAQGERTKRGRPARKSGQSRRQRAIDPEKLRIVREMMVGGTDYYEIQFTLSERWGVSMRTVRDWRARVLEMMREEVESEGFLDPGMETQLALQQLESERLRAITRNDGRTVVACIRLRAQIVGVLAADRHLHLHQPPPSPAQPALGPGSPGPSDPAMAAKMELARRLAERYVGRAVIDMAPAAPGEAGK